MQRTMTGCSPSQVGTGKDDLDLNISRLYYIERRSNIFVVKL